MVRGRLLPSDVAMTLAVLSIILANRRPQGAGPHERRNRTGACPVTLRSSRASGRAHRPRDDDPQGDQSVAIPTVSWTALLSAHQHLPNIDAGTLPNPHVSVVGSANEVRARQQRRRHRDHHSEIALRCFQRLADLHQRLAGVPEEHPRVVMIEERVIDARESVSHASLEHNDIASTIDVEDRHSIDRTRRIVPRRGIDYVVRPHDKHDVSLRELAIHLVHLQQLIVRDVCLREQNVHVSRHPPRDWMNRVLHVDASLLQIGRKLADSVLRLCNRETVPERRRLSRGSERNRGILVLVASPLPTQTPASPDRCACSERAEENFATERFIAVLINT